MTRPAPDSRRVERVRRSQLTVSSAAGWPLPRSGGPATVLRRYVAIGCLIGLTSVPCIAAEQAGAAATATQEPPLSGAVNGATTADDIPASGDTASGEIASDNAAADNPPQDTTSAGDTVVEDGTAATDVTTPEWIQPLVEAARDSVVVITVEGRDGRQVGMGTGFVVSTDGLIATNLHVIGEARPINVRFRDGRQYPITEVHASDRHLDLAVVRIAASDLKALTLVDDDSAIQAGRPFIALGNPMGLRHSVVQGIVSGMREIDGNQMVQVAMPIESGNSGGPLLDPTGHVMGVVTMKSAVTANLGFAMPASALRLLLQRPNPVAMTKWQTIGALDPKQWLTRFGARWRQQSGAIVVSESGQGFGGRALCLQHQDTPNHPYEVGVFVKLDDEAGAAGLVFNSDQQDRHYGFYPSAGRLRLTRFNGPTVYSWEVLEEIDSPHYLPGEWNHLKVRLEGQKLLCYVNDQLVVERRNSPPPTRGKVGLAKFRDTRATFRQFQLLDEIGATRPTLQQLEPLNRKIAALALDEWTSSEQVADFLASPKISRFALDQRAAFLRDQARRLTQLANDVHVHDVCQKLAALFALPTEEISLARGALLISSLDNPAVDVEACLAQLAGMAREVELQLPEGDRTDATRLRQLNQYLFRENGFHGSRTNYYHAANSYFDRLLDDREGLPLTISILYIELGQRLGLDIEGVGIPGHFMVRFKPQQGEPQLLDVFDQATPVTTAAARRRAFQATGQSDESHLAATGAREILLRMLRNLQGVAQRNRESESLLRYLEAMVRLQPDDVSLRGMRAVVRHETGRRKGAIEDLDWIIAAEPRGVNMRAIIELRQRFMEP